MKKEMEATAQDKVARALGVRLPAPRPVQEQTPLRLISKAKDGAWDICDMDGAVVYRTARKPTTDWFLWAILMEQRAHTKLLERIGEHLYGVGLWIESAPDHTEGLAEINSSLDSIAARASEAVEVLEAFEADGIVTKKAKK